MSRSRETKHKFLVAERITADPAVCGGRPCIAGTRMRVMDLLAMMAEGETVEEILADFDYLEREDIRAAILYAANLLDHAVIVAA